MKSLVCEQITIRKILPALDQLLFPRADCLDSSDCLVVGRFNKQFKKLTLSVRPLSSPFVLVDIFRGRSGMALSWRDSWMALSWLS